MNSSVICAVSNNEYFHYLEILALSLDKHARGCILYVELINVPEYKVQWLLSLGIEVVVKKYYIKFPNKDIVGVDK